MHFVYFEKARFFLCDADIFNKSEKEEYLVGYLICLTLFRVGHC